MAEAFAVGRDTPFQSLVAWMPADRGRPDTMLYLPLFNSDNAPLVIGDFPDVNDQAAGADYYFDPDQLGALRFEVEVDGVVTSLGRAYAVGTETPPLPSDGATGYTTFAVFLTPLSKGVHNVTYRALLIGDAWKEYLIETGQFDAHF